MDIFLSIHETMCKSHTVLPETSEDTPRSQKASTYSWYVPIKERGSIFPQPANLLVKPQPVKQWNPNKVLKNLSFVHFVFLNFMNAFSPMAYLSIRQHFSLVPVNLNIKASISACFDNATINTSVSDAAITMELYVELPCLVCSSIRVSASS